MSFMDKLKSWFSGGSEGATTADEPGTMPVDAPAAPVDPLGTPMPGSPATMPPPTGMEAETDTDARDDEV
jgi:hypothetical protein